MDKFKGHNRPFFNCLWCKQKTNIMLNNCAHCGFVVHKDQKEYHKTRNHILIQRRLKILQKMINSLISYKDIQKPNSTLINHLINREKKKIEEYFEFIEKKLLQNLSY